MRFAFAGMGILWIFHILGVIIMLVIVFAVIRLAIHGSWHRSGRFEERFHGRSAQEAMEILNKRYASGEITKEDYDRMKKDILG